MTTEAADPVVEIIHRDEEEVGFSACGRNEKQREETEGDHSHDAKMLLH